MNKIKTPPNPDFRPLYVQVMEIISKRIEKGEWGPGEVLPAEPKFAEELGVSQGTVRKALDNIARKKSLSVARAGERSWRSTARICHCSVFSESWTEPGKPSCPRAGF